MKILILLYLFIPFISHSQELKIQPVYGFERTYNVEPKPARYRTEIFLGVRALYGTKRIAAEAEINQANSNDSFNDIDYKYTTQTMMLGLRLIPWAAEYYSLYLRGGARFRKRVTERTQNGDTSTTTEGPNFDPYAGGGITINVSGLINVNASATLVYNRNAEAGEQYDTRYTLSGGFRFGNR